MSTLVHIVPSLKMGGLEMLLTRLLRLQAQKWDVHVVCLDEVGQLADDARACGVTVHEIGGLALSPVRKLARVTRLLRSLRPDVLHSHNPAAHLYALLSHPAVGSRGIVHTRHGQQRFLPSLAPMLHRLSAWWTARTIAVSEDVATMVQVSERFPASKCSILRNGVDMSMYGAARGAIDQAITVGRLDPLKDHATLLRAAALVRLRHPGFRLRIVGDGAERNTLLALREELRLQDCVEFLGTRRDIPELLAESGLYVISSISEGVPISLLEAMASRLPVVSTRVGGIPEVIEEGRTGRLVAPRDPSALADAICAVIESADNARQLAEAGWHTATTKYGLDQLAHHYEAIYATALAGA